MKVNLQGAIGVMDALRAVGEQLGSPQIYLFTSTDYVTCFNGSLAHAVRAQTASAWLRFPDRKAA